ncbi:CocE/NonD family hydrolase [soil metagenome]
MMGVSSFLSLLSGVPRPSVRIPVVEGHTVEMADGIRLATDVHRPAGPGRWPVVLIRTPYGRTGLTGVPIYSQAKLLAASGYAVVVQDVRGRFDSGGEFLPMVGEAPDGGRTVEWITDQPWSNGRLGCWGMSYLAATAWAAVAGAPGQVDALAIGIGHSRLGLPDPQGVLHLDTTLRWLRSLEIMHGREDSVARRLRALLDARRKDADMLLLMHHLPVGDLDERVLGTSSAIWQAWAAHPSPTDPFWSAGDQRAAVATAPPTVHTAGWWDVFVDQQLDDYAVQVQHDRAPGLLVGGWTHLDPRVQVASFRQMRGHFDTHLRDADETEREARVWLGGARRWWTMPTWPPATQDVELLLTGSTLAEGDAVTTGAPIEVAYDPADPTPSVGGRSLSFDAGRANCAVLEARPDVAVLTGAPLPRPHTLAGRARLRARITADGPSADLSVRVTDVDPAGRSVSVTDGYARVVGAGNGAEVEILLHPVAFRFAAGHRIRLLIAGGAFPHFDRNLGSGADPARDTTARPSTVTVHPGASLLVPVLR